mgnify:CR=1 FL=1
MRGHSRCVNSFFSCPYIFTSRHVTEKAEFPQMTAKMVSFLRLPLAAKSTTQNKHTRILTPLVWGTRACVYSSVSLIFHFEPTPTFQVYSRLNKLLNSWAEAANSKLNSIDHRHQQKDRTRAHCAWVHAALLMAYQLLIWNFPHNLD